MVKAMALAFENKREISERVMKEKEELFSAQPHLDIDRLKIELEVYGEGDAKFPAMQRSKILIGFASRSPFLLTAVPL